MTSSARLAPRLMPDRTTSGGESFMICASASITASVGVPVTEKRRSSCRRKPHRRGQRQRVAGARLFFCRRDDPDVVAEPAARRFRGAAARARSRRRHWSGGCASRRLCGSRPGCRNREAGAAKIAPYSQQLGDFFTAVSSVLVNGRALTIAPLGDGGLCSDKSR